ncbi:hypothetical protein [Bradyrhizobium sp. Leo121]|uniref:hypothetical protein n=1 Tax=Bradyrhizobium sp. Leo121 TaxID=1571195 RepID=UPI001029C7E6|nr:hypothetical protein [Bradyrhizobium sp. Leo121]RZN30465.1 hypothetical protein CWO90_20220 [Bradyrhizobium sp. Leo121]
MKLKAQAGQFSSIVGSAVLLLEPDGKAFGQLAMIGLSTDLTTSQRKSVVEQAAKLLDGKIEIKD